MNIILTSVQRIRPDMDRESKAFAVPFATFALGLIVLLVGMFQSGLTVLTIVGIVIALFGLAGLVYVAVSVTEPAHEE